MLVGRVETGLGRVARLDAAVLRRVRTLRHSAAGDAVLSWDSRLREHGALWLAIGLAGATVDRRRRYAWARACAAVAVTEAASQGLKRATRRPRPSLRGLPPLVATPSRYSFPSAHTAAAVAAGRSFPGPGIARYVGAVAVATGLSRLYTGVHYPSDVAAGAALGWAVGTAFR